jgi:hypothetical protein
MWIVQQIILVGFDARQGRMRSYRHSDDVHCLSGQFSRCNACSAGAAGEMAEEVRRRADKT